MIFVTVGTQLPFDRLVGAMDRWAAANPTHHVIAQVGRTRTTFKNLEVRGTIDRSEFERLYREAAVIVSHAGMGSVLSAARIGARLVVMPRRADLGEHRDDHQIQTARRLLTLGLVSVAWSDVELSLEVERLLNSGLPPTQFVSTRGALVTALRDIVRSEILG